METYRNNIDVITTEGVFVEEGSLWRREGELMILMDDDEYATFPYSESKFRRVYRVNINGGPLSQDDLE